MKRSLRRALWAGAVVALGGRGGADGHRRRRRQRDRHVRQGADWGTGHETRVTVTNGTSATVDTWRIEFDLPSGTTISTFWDADVTSSGNHYVAVKKSWAGPLAPGATFSWGYNGTGPFAGAAELHRQRRLLRRRHPADHHAPPTTAAAAHRRPPTTPPPTTPPPDHPAAARRQEAARLLRRVGRLRPQLPRQEHPHQRVGRQADPHQLRVRQRHQRPVHHR